MSSSNGAGACLLLASALLATACGSVSAADPDASLDGSSGDGALDTHEVTVAVMEVDGKGSLQANGEDCTTGCTVSVVAGDALVLTATPDRISRPHWIDLDCEGNRCEIAPDADAAIEVAFTLAHNVVFITSTEHDGAAIGPLEDADARCAALAASAGLHHQDWVALLGSAAPCPGADAGPCTPEQRLAGARGWLNMEREAVFDQFAQMQAGEFWHPVRYDDTGEQELTTVVLTGINGALEDGLTCNDYMSNSAADGYSWGRGTSISENLYWQNSNGDCDQMRPHYCFSRDYNAELTPETGSGRLAFLSKGTWTPGGGLADADEFCQREACDAGLTGSPDCLVDLGNSRTFLALLESGGTAAGSRFDPAGADYYRADGLFWLPASALEKQLEAFFARTGLVVAADGTYVGEAIVWSGSGGDDCSAWGSTANSGRAGSSDTINAGFVSSTSPLCNSDQHLYCLEE